VDLDAFASGLVSSRAQSMNSFATEFSVRSLSTTIATGLGRIGSFTGNALTGEGTSLKCDGAPTES
jgi:prolipoprotein diacylglyceryltransferase